jgi:hypothetical protein
MDVHVNVAMVYLQTKCSNIQMGEHWHSGQYLFTGLGYPENQVTLKTVQGREALEN